MIGPTDYYRELTYVSRNPFIGSRLKLRRAKRHLIELENITRELPRRQGYNFVVGPKADTGQFQLITMPIQSMPMEYSMVVGDAIHNLRSLLDHVAVALVAPPLGTGKANDAYFPTGVDKSAFIDARDGFTRTERKRVSGKMEGASADALSLVEELEPYGGGKNSLRALHDLDILDKHKLIVPAVSRLTISKLEALAGDTRLLLGAADFKLNEDGTNLTALVDVPEGIDADNFKFDGNFEAAFEVVFAKGQPLEGQPIVPTLREIANVCEGFIKACETVFLGEEKSDSQNVDLSQESSATTPDNYPSKSKQ